MQEELPWAALTADTTCVVSAARRAVTFVTLIPSTPWVPWLLTPQMSAKRGLKVFGERGALAVMKELDQIIQRKVMRGRRAGELSRQEKENALKYLMFLKEKRCGRLRAEVVRTVESSDFGRQKMRQHPRQ